MGHKARKGHSSVAQLVNKFDSGKEGNQPLPPSKNGSVFSSFGFAMEGPKNQYTDIQ
jgi:hypothetical protein